ALRAARSRAGDQPLRAARLHRPPDPQLRRVPEVHRGRLPRRPAARPPHRWPPGSTALGARERLDSRQPTAGLRLQPEAAQAAAPAPDPAGQAAAEPAAGAPQLMRARSIVAALAALALSAACAP